MFTHSKHCSGSAAVSAIRATVSGPRHLILILAWTKSFIGKTLLKFSRLWNSSELCNLPCLFQREIFSKLRLKGLQMEMVVGERGVDVGGQRPCTKHVSGLVSNMLPCRVKYSGGSMNHGAELVWPMPRCGMKYGKCGDALRFVVVLLGYVVQARQKKGLILGPRADLVFALN